MSEKNTNATGAGQTKSNGANASSDVSASDLSSGIFQLKGTTQLDISFKDGDEKKARDE